ncbi:MAG: hypothetical protein R3C61_18845 [Bacteroidia bacterium]
MSILSPRLDPWRAPDRILCIVFAIVLLRLLYIWPSILTCFRALQMESRKLYDDLVEGIQIRPDCGEFLEELLSIDAHSEKYGKSLSECCVRCKKRRGGAGALLNGAAWVRPFRL